MFGRQICVGPLGNNGTQTTLTKQALLIFPPSSCPNVVFCDASSLPRADALPKFL